MNERRWLRADEDDLLAMAHFAVGAVSARKLRLFAVGCCRLIWPLIPARQCKEGVAVAEQFADGATTKKALTAARRAVRAVREAFPDEGAYWRFRAIHACEGTVKPDLLNVVHGTPIDVCGTVICRPKRDYDHVTKELTLALMHDVAGPLPFRKVKLKPAWLTSTVLALAQQMYESRDFSAMPILADALQDAGCDDDRVLGHCRGPGPHCRGCWVVDLILGKE